jgi:hypothetical protein
MPAVAGGTFVLITDVEALSLSIDRQVLGKDVIGDLRR